MDGIEVLGLALVGAGFISAFMAWLGSRAFDAQYGKPGIHREGSR